VYRNSPLAFRLYHAERKITAQKYIPFAQEQIYNTKHADLAAFLESRSEQLRRSGSELEWADYHVLMRGLSFCVVRL